MNCTSFKLLLALPLFVFATTNSFSQNLQGDTDLHESMLESAVVSYYNAGSGDLSRLYNGPEYSFYDPAVKGNAYLFDNNSFTNGSIEYDGFSYKSVPMMYDVFKDYVVLLLPDKSAKISLLSERVQNFDWLNHHFVYINTDTLSKNKGVSTGFYDQVYKGKIELLVKRSKNIQKSSGTESSFTSKNDIYIKKDGIYSHVNSQASLLNILKDKKEELKLYINNNQIEFDSDKEQATIKVAAYYDQLTPLNTKNKESERIFVAN
ncbi:MAG: hypothetical protein JWR05_2858 [Mucilaginibacter sp.]|nr:hypothetical protein [Mucilaginibacter sp.]